MLTRWGLIAGLAAAGALVAGIVYYRDHIIQGVTGAGFTAGQSIGAIPSSLAGGLQSGLNPLREVLGQAPAPVPTYNYNPPVINSNPAIQAAQPQQLTSIAPPPPPAPTSRIVTQFPRTSSSRARTTTSTSTVSPYKPGTPTVRSTIRYASGVKVTAPLSAAAIRYYKSRGVNPRPT